MEENVAELVSRTGKCLPSIIKLVRSVSEKIAKASKKRSFLFGNLSNKCIKLLCQIYSKLLAVFPRSQSAIQTDILMGSKSRKTPKTSRKSIPKIIKSKSEAKKKINSFQFLNFGYILGTCLRHFVHKALQNPRSSLLTLQKYFYCCAVLIKLA